MTQHSERGSFFKRRKFTVWPTVKEALLAREIGAALERVSQNKEATARRLDELRQRFRGTRQKLADAGVNRVLGRYLGEERHGST